MAFYDLFEGVHHGDMLICPKWRNQIFQYQSELVSNGNTQNCTYLLLLTNAGRLQAKIPQGAVKSRGTTF